MNTLVVTHVEPFSQGSDSAEVTLTGKLGEITVFCYPCDLKVGDIVPNHLSGSATEAFAAYLSDWPEDLRAAKAKERLERTGPFSYRGCGRVINKSAGLIEVFGFIIEIDDIPCNGPIEFELERVSL